MRLLACRVYCCDHQFRVGWLFYLEVFQKTLEQLLADMVPLDRMLISGSAYIFHIWSKLWEMTTKSDYWSFPSWKYNEEEDAKEWHDDHTTIGVWNTFNSIQAI